VAIIPLLKSFQRGNLVWFQRILIFHRNRSLKQGAFGVKSQTHTSPKHLTLVLIAKRHANSPTIPKRPQELNLSLSGFRPTIFGWPINLWAENSLRAVVWNFKRFASHYLFFFEIAGWNKSSQK